MSLRKWRETKQQLIWWPDLALLGCSLVSLHFQCDILAPITVDTVSIGYIAIHNFRWIARRQWASSTRPWTISSKTTPGSRISSVWQKFSYISSLRLLQMLPKSLTWKDLKQTIYWSAHLVAENCWLSSNSKFCRSINLLNCNSQFEVVCNEMGHHVPCGDRGCHTFPFPVQHPTGWGGHLFWRFCNIFSKSSPWLFGQHAALLPGPIFLYYALKGPGL